LISAAERALNKVFKKPRIQSVGADISADMIKNRVIMRENTFFNPLLPQSKRFGYFENSKFDLISPTVFYV
jgi:hypothetical protein